MEQKKRKSSATIASIETEYVRSQQKKASRKHARKIRLYRRLAVFAVVAAIILGGMTQMYIKQKQVLEAKELEKMEKITQFKEVQQEQEALNRQLIKLDDDDYIAKLARKDYFLSENNEIIFSIPEIKKKTDKKDNGKE